MTKSDSLDHITLDSYEIKNIENFEKNYYNHKNNIIQKGGNNKLEKNILRLYNCFILSKNQNGGNDNLSLQIKKKLDKKINKLANNLIGGKKEEDKKEEDIISSNNSQITNMLIAYIKKILSDEEIKTNITTLLNNKEIYSNIKIISDWLTEYNNKPIIIFIIDNIIDNITNMLKSYIKDKSNIDKIILKILSMLDNESNIDNIKYISENILPYITDIIKKINPDKILLDALGNNVNKGITDFSNGAVDVATNVLTGFGNFIKKQALIQNKQKGGNNNKLEKNILRLYNCYILSKNQNGGNNNLSLQIKKRLDKKINKLANNLIGGELNNGQITDMLIALIKKNLSYEEIKTNITKLLNNKEIYSNIQIISNWLVEDNNKKKIKDFIIPIIIFIIDNITNMLKSYIEDASNIEKIISMLDNKSNIDNIKYIIRKHILPYITDIIKKINPDKILYDALGDSVNKGITKFSTDTEGIASYSIDGLRHIIKQILKPLDKENKTDSDNNSSNIIKYYNTQEILDNAANKK
jgi:hypothetical protein